MVDIRGGAIYGSRPTPSPGKGDFLTTGVGISERKEVLHKMLNVLTAIITFLHRDDEEGQGLAEYALILALIAIVAIIALIFLGTQVSKILSTVGASV